MSEIVAKRGGGGGCWKNLATSFMWTMIDRTGPSESGLFIT